MYEGGIPEHGLVPKGHENFVSKDSQNACRLHALRLPAGASWHALEVDAVAAMLGDLLLALHELLGQLIKRVQDRVTALSHDLHEMLSQLIVRTEERVTALSQDLHEMLCQLVVRAEETVATLS